MIYGKETEKVHPASIHYDEYPFISGGEKRIDWWQQYINEMMGNVSINKMIDIGSGNGEISKAFKNIYPNVFQTCLDISDKSLEICKKNNAKAFCVHGSALSLPFSNSEFDFSLAIGSIHHTGDTRKAFTESARVLKKNGHLLLFVYSYWSLYHLIFKVFSPLCKRFPVSIIPGFLLWPFQFLSLIHLGTFINKDEARALLADKLWTPYATFHSFSELKKWGKEEGLYVKKRKVFFLGYANVILFQKKS